MFTLIAKSYCCICLKINCTLIEKMSYNAREQETTSFAKIRIALFQANYRNRTFGMFMKGKYNSVVDHLSLTKPKKVEKTKSVWICYFVRDYLPHRKPTFTSALTFALLKSYSLFLSSYEDIKIKLCTFTKWNKIIIQLVKWMSPIDQSCYLFFSCFMMFCFAFAESNNDSWLYQKRFPYVFASVVTENITFFFIHV